MLACYTVGVELKKPIEELISNDMRGFVLDVINDFTATQIKIRAIGAPETPNDEQKNTIVAEYQLQKMRSAVGNIFNFSFTDEAFKNILDISKTENNSSVIDLIPDEFFVNKSIKLKDGSYILGIAIFDDMSYFYREIPDIVRKKDMWIVMKELEKQEAVYLREQLKSGNNNRRITFGYLRVKEDKLIITVSDLHSAYTNDIPDGVYAKEVKEVSKYALNVIRAINNDKTDGLTMNCWLDDSFFMVI